MRKRNIVRPAMFHERAFRSLSPDARHLLMTLLTCPEASLIPVMFMTMDQMSYYTGRTVGAIAKAIANLIENETVRYDRDMNMILFINYLKYNPLVSPKLENGYEAQVDALPDHEFKELARSMAAGELPDRVSDTVSDRVSIPLKEKKKEKVSSLNSEEKETVKSQAETVLQFLNETTGKNFGDATNIEACLIREKCTVEDCKAVISFKWEEWTSEGKGNHKYVNSTTPWRPLHFKGYLDQAKAGPGHEGKKTQMTTEFPEL